MQIKSELRKELKLKRKNIDQKADKDLNICENLICSDLYLNAEQVLFYAALEDEINIDACINDALMLGKKVALPVCTDNAGNMKFYYIDSLSDLKFGFFGVREPDAETCMEVENFTDSICVVPALAYNKNGYRLGYGKGYYDRFLQNYSSLSVGLCYNELLVDDLPTEECDIPVNYIITQDSVIAV
ncbi:MAG: 5-formyltetrahydrofolate cyclo-ligase [Clostridium sp.]|nr:5-formyltetrahydrofolate cyclo-ligase [Clostridium sp.]